MKSEIFVNTPYLALKEYLEVIPDSFQGLGYELHSGRNELRVIIVKGQLMVVKYFKRITWANRLIYSTVRKSKARRSFENSLRLLSLGISTPEPIAYIDIYENGLLSKSFYICLFADYLPVKDLFYQPLAESEEGLKAFARFTYKLHQAGIYHNDYNLGNVLFDQEGVFYDFSLIDNNRMSFSKYSKQRGFKNLQRLQLPLDKAGIVGVEYARVSQSEGLSSLLAMILFRIQFRNRNWLKRKLKALF